MLKPLAWRLKLFLAHPASAKYSLSRRLYNLIISRLPSKKVKCNVCGWEGFKFRAIAGASYIRYNASCPGCGSAERQRALIEYLNKKGSLSEKGINILDIGPVRGFRTYFEAKGCNYISIDLISSTAMVKMDATQMSFSDDTFDFIICSHVLEHIKDDIRAIKEMFRVLRSEGVCYIMVPFNRNRTDSIEYEKPNILEIGHVRAYGLDILDRIKSVWFKVEMINLIAELGKDNISRYGIGTEEFCFLCAKARVLLPYQDF